MKIYSIIENISNEYGGPANSLPNLLEAIRSQLNIDSVIYSTITNDNEENEFVTRFSIPWVRCKLSGVEKLKYSKALKKTLTAELSKQDVLFSNNLWNYPALLSAQLARKKKIPHIISIRGTLYPWSLAQGKYRKKLAWKFFQRKALQHANLIHVTCADEYKAVRNLGITSPIAIVPHGINYEDYQNLIDRENAVEHLGLRKDKKYILFMSRLHKKKGLDILLDVWPALVKKHPEWCLLVVGPDYSNYTNRINKLATECNIENNIQALGMLSGHDKKCVLASAEFFVLPTYTENFGVVIGEALAAGLPTITTTGTPWSEIRSYNCGKYISLSKENLTKSLHDMMSLDKKSLMVMSNNAKSLIKENYSWSAQAIKFGKALDFVLNGEQPIDVVFFQGDTPPSNIL